MKTDRLEEFIKANKKEFDIHSPSPDVWKKLDKKLQQSGKKYWIRSRWLKVAAILVFAILSSGVLFRSYIINNYELQWAAQSDPELKELLDAEAYYSSQVDYKLTEIRKCYDMVPELQIEVEDDLQELEIMYEDLKKDLKENISNKEVIEAMIENNRYRMKLVDDVLEQINC